MTDVKLITVMSAVLLLSCGAIAQQADKHAGTPRIVCTEATFNFGTVDNTTKVVHDFTIRNKGTAPLKLGRISSSCGCTVATLAEKLLGPGEETVLKTTTDLAGRRGVQSKHIGVESNDPATPTLRLWIKGSALSLLSTEPAHVQFGGVGMNVAATREIRLVGQTEGVRITRVTCDNKNFTIKIWPPDDKRGLGVDVSLVPQSQVTYLRNQVTIETNHPKKPKLTVSAFAQIRGAIETAPRIVVLRRRQAGPQTRMILVRPGTRKTFSIAAVDCPVEGVKVEVRRESQSNYRIMLRDLLVTDELDGKVITITTSLPEMREIKVPIKIVP